MTVTADRAMSALERSRRLVLPEFISRNARLHPDKAAMIFGDDALTYAQLDERTNRLANALAARGVRRGDNVAILTVNGLECVEAFFGCHKAGATPVPVNFRLVQDEVDYILDNSGAVGVIADEHLAERAASAAAHVESVRFHLAVGAAPAGAEPYEDALAAAPAGDPVVPLDEDDVAFLMYTSGTTGRPKGAMLTHQNLYAQTVNWTHEVGGVGDEAVWRAGAPLFHIAGVAGILPFLWLGGTAVVAPSTEFEPDAAIEELRRHGVTHTFFVPTQWDMVCRRPQAASLASTLRKAIWGASPALRSTLELMSETLPGVDILSNFGQTEMSPSTTWLKGADAIRKMGSVGRPSINVEVRIVDDEMRDVPRGEVGEIVYRGATVMKGYFRNERATAEAFEGGWFHSGDLVREDEDGYLYVVDRKKDMIISGGENVYPAEVETALLAHEAVADVAVVGIPHPKWVETPFAVVVRAAGVDVTERELIDHCRERLAGYKKPSGVAFVDVLPRNAGGKVLKRTLRETYAGRSA
jgi:acyl-CoA synthetase (AMP-forming)/AMP-acid ligase II